MSDAALQQAIQALSVVLPMGYLAATVLFGMAFAGERQPRIAAPRRILFGLVLAAHAGLLVAMAVLEGGFPVVGTWRSVSAVALVSALLFGVLTLRTPQHTAGAVVLGLVTVLVTAASAFGPLDGRALHDGAAKSTQLLALHGSTSVLASAALVLSGVYGALYLVLYRQMRTHHFGPVFRQLPDLELLTRTTRKAAFAGFLCMTLGLNVGIWVAHRDSVAGFQYTDPGVLLTMGIWIHFGLIAFSRWIPGLSARRASFAATLGLAALTVTALVSLAPGLTFHSRG